MLSHTLLSVRLTVTRITFHCPTFRTLSSGSPSYSHPMGNSDSRQKFQQCLTRLCEPGQELSLAEEAVWDQLCQDHVSSVTDVFNLLQPNDLRKLKDSAPQNLCKLCVKVRL